MVCVHGFTGHALRDAVSRRAARRAPASPSHGLRLPGHGTRVADLDATRWSDWADAVEDAFDTLAMLHDRVARRRPVARRPARASPREPASRCRRRRLRWRRRCGSTGSAGARRALGRVAACSHRDRARSRSSAGSDVRDRRTAAENPRLRRDPDARARPARRVHADHRRRAADASPSPCSCFTPRHDHTAPVACAARIADAHSRGAHAHPRAQLSRDRRRRRTRHRRSRGHRLLRRHVRPAATGDLACAT